MQLFLLTLIAKGGVRTVYQLKRDALLSQGGVRSALKWLQENDYLERSGPLGDLNRKEIAVTRRGLEVLEYQWRKGVDEILNWDTDTSLRFAWVALLMDKAAGLEALHSSARGSQTVAKYFQQQAEQGCDIGSPVSVYRWMRVVLTAERDEAESRALTRIAEYLDAHLNTDRGAIKC